MRSTFAVAGLAALTLVLAGCSTDGTEDGATAPSTSVSASASASASPSEGSGSDESGSDESASDESGFVDVPDLTGLTGQEAVAQLEELGLVASDLTDGQLTQAVRGTVPAAGDRTALGATVVVLLQPAG